MPARTPEAAIARQLKPQDSPLTEHIGSDTAVGQERSHAAQHVMRRTRLCRYEADIGSFFPARLAVPSYAVAIGFR